MAAHAEQSLVGNCQRNSCFIHFSAVEKVDIKPFTSSSWSKVSDCALFWKDYDDHEQGKVAKKFIAAHRDFASSSEPPTTGGFHRKCYQKFTDSTKMKRAEKKKVNDLEAPTLDITTSKFKSFEYCHY